MASAGDVPLAAAAAAAAVTDEDAWTFDVAGWIRVPAVLSPAELADAAAHLAADRPAAAAAPLRAHPAVVGCIPEFACGQTLYRLDHPPRALPPPSPSVGGSGDGGGWLNSDAVEDQKRLGYSIVGTAATPADASQGSPAGGRRADVRGFRVLWVLEDTELCAPPHRCACPPRHLLALLPAPAQRSGLALAAVVCLPSWRAVHRPTGRAVPCGRRRRRAGWVW